ncbi:MAG: superoxide dismutase [Bacteroidales bacterium]|nr:superoxide dismutase [Candidatus Colicola faecequi]
MKTVFLMPTLPYEVGSLAPAISAETIGYHFGKHLQTYVNNLNNLIAGTEFEESPLEEIAAKATGALANNAGQVLNHTLYFEQLAPAATAPSGALLEAIERDFGSADELKSKLTQAATGLFGSGWAWLCADSEGHLSILQMPNADNPLRHGLKPLLTIDVWEHAYYLDYQNRRPDYVAAIWNIINWRVVEARYGA